MTLQSRGGGVAADIEALAPWFHNLRLPDGRQTAPDHPLGDFPSYKWAEVAAAIPEDLRGCRALDIGCNAGYYSFALAGRGADVVAIDHDEHYLDQARWARERYGLEDKVELRHLGVYDLAHLRETFDLVLFMGVLYHLRHPLLALDIVAERVGGTLVLQTLTMPSPPGEQVPEDVAFDRRGTLCGPAWPAMAFVEHRLADDPTNWWVPNEQAVEAMVRSTGMEVVARPGHELWVCEPSGRNPNRDELDHATGRSGIDG
jgi:tRNA (mo5U34)-methyltransferase